MLYSKFSYCMKWSKTCYFYRLRTKKNQSVEKSKKAWHAQIYNYDSIRLAAVILFT